MPLYRDATDERIRELNLQKRAIGRAPDSYGRYEPASPDGATVLEYLPRRQMYVPGTAVNFYDYDIAEHEKISFANAGTILKKENFMERRLYSTEATGLRRRRRTSTACHG